MECGCIFLSFTTEFLGVCLDSVEHDGIIEITIRIPWFWCIEIGSQFGQYCDDILSILETSLIV
jgi:hypothetical protein